MCLTSLFGPLRHSSITLTMFVFVLQAIFPHGGIAAEQPGVWLESTEDGGELVLRGRLLDFDSKPIADGVVQVFDWPSPLNFNPRQRTIQYRNGEFTFKTKGLNGAMIWAATVDRSRQLVKRLSSHEIASVAQRGVEMVLERSKLLAVRVTESGMAVADAHVLVLANWSIFFDGTTDSKGIAKIMLPRSVSPTFIRAWTEDRKIGLLDFRDISSHDTEKTLQQIELTKCKSVTVAVRRPDGTAYADLPIKLGVSNSTHRWMIPQGLFESQTDSEGRATFDYVPDWMDVTHSVLVDDPALLFVRESTDVAGKTTYVVGKNSDADSVTADFQVKLPKGCLGGLRVEGFTFEGTDAMASRVFYARMDAEGRFRATVIAGFTYCLFIDDNVWVSKPVAAILVDPQTRSAALPDLELCVGEKVVVTLTAGPNRLPVANESVHFQTRDRFEWQINGEKRTGNAGRRWAATTDANGKVETRAYPWTLEARATDGLSTVEKRVMVERGEVNKLELHRTHVVPIFVYGRLLFADSSGDSKQNWIAREPSRMQLPRTENILDSHWWIQATSILMYR